MGLKSKGKSIPCIINTIIIIIIIKSLPLCKTKLKKIIKRVMCPQFQHEWMCHSRFRMCLWCRVPFWCIRAL